MCRSTARVICLVVVTPLLALTLFAQQPTPAEPVRQAVTLTPIERFDGPTAWRTKAGVLQHVRVVIHNWGIHGRQRILTFPEQGMVIVELRGGEVTTVINGKKEKRKAGDFWTVPAGSSMSVEVTSESATLQTMAVRAR